LKDPNPFIKSDLIRFIKSRHSEYTDEKEPL